MFDSTHGWTVVQRRFDGSENFDRNWEGYVNGFGSLNGEYWLGEVLPLPLSFGPPLPPSQALSPTPSPTLPPSFFHPFTFSPPLSFLNNNLFIKIYPNAERIYFINSGARLMDWL